MKRRQKTRLRPFAHGLVVALLLGITAEYSLSAVTVTKQKDGSYIVKLPQLAQTGPNDLADPGKLLDTTVPRINPTGRMIELRVPFREGDREIGSVVLRIGADDSLSVTAQGVLPLLEDILDAEVLEALVSAAVDGQLTPESFAAADLDLEFDSGLLELRLATPVELRRDRILSLTAEDVVPADITRPNGISGYVNILGGITHSSDGQDEEQSGLGQFTNLTIDLDTALRIFGPVVESEFTIEDTELDGNRAFFRRGTRVIVDDAEHALRYAGGDLLLSGEGFQDSIDLLGLGLARDFSLQPTRNVRPTARREFTIERPSTVDVLVNGVRLRRLRLDPGTFDLRDIPLSTGANDIELVIEDDAGNVDRIRLQSFFDFDLLAPGIVTFGVGAGYLSDIEESEVVYDFQEPVVSAFVRGGVLPSLTMGVNAQASTAAQQAGIQATMPSVIGLVAFDVAGSNIDALGAGWAAGGDYEFPFGEEDSANRRLLFSAEYVSADFGGADFSNEDVADAEPLNDTALDLSIDYSQDLFGSMRGSIGANYAMGRGTRGDRYSVGGNLIGRLGTASWTLNLDYEQEQSPSSSEFGVTASLVIPFGRKQDVELSVDSTNREVRSIYSFREGSSRIGDFNLSAGLERNEEEALAVEASADYVGNRFRAALDHDTRLTELRGSERVTTTRLRGETAIAFAGGQLAVGRPISDSFAIVTTHPTLEDRQVFVDPSDDGDVATSGLLGPALVPTLSAYNTRRLTYDVDDLPLGYDLGAGAFTLLPSYRSGFNLEVGSAATVTMIGNLTDAEGEPIGLVSGQAMLLDDDSFEPVIMFTNRVGKFAISGLRPGRYELRLNTDAGDILEFEVPEDTVGLYRAGTLAIPGRT